MKIDGIEHRLRPEHRQWLEAALAALEPLCNATNQPALCDAVATELLHHLQDWRVPSWEACPVLARALRKLITHNLDAEDAKARRE
jgi:hypothetical protein